MGKETRRNNVYYYRKKRKGKRVVSEYVGGGEVVQLADRMAALERERKQENRAMAELRQREAGRINALIDRHSAMVDQLVEAHLLALGYHKHNREWRLRRG